MKAGQYPPPAQEMPKESSEERKEVEDKGAFDFSHEDQHAIPAKESTEPEITNVPYEAKVMDNPPSVPEEEKYPTQENQPPVEGIPHYLP